MNLETIRSRIDYQTASLALVALLVSAALALTHVSTHEPIAAAEARDLQASLGQVLPEGFFDNVLIEDTVRVETPKGPVTVYRARKAGAVQGVVYQMGNPGYSGTITLVMGVDRDGRILGVRVTKHTETPGLGDKIEAAKGDWVLAFNGKHLGDPAPERWAVKKDGGVFDQFAGATITPRAVVKTVKEGLDFFAAHREQLLASDNSTQEKGQAR
ncbi:MAG: electron transport complex subunit RsxG [Rhodocyclaceae bacterium]